MSGKTLPAADSLYSNCCYFFSFLKSPPFFFDSCFLYSLFVFFFKRIYYFYSFLFPCFLLGTIQRFLRFFKSAVQSTEALIQKVTLMLSLTLTRFYFYSANGTCWLWSSYLTLQMTGVLQIYKSILFLHREVYLAACFLVFLIIFFPRLRMQLSYHPPTICLACVSLYFFLLPKNNHFRKKKSA